MFNFFPFSILINIRNEFSKDRIPILLYHRVLTDVDKAINKCGDERIFAIGKDKFEEQMRLLLQEGYTSISLDNLIEYIKGKRKLFKKPILITFDDGWKSTFDNAYPILKKHNLRATVFVSTDPSAQVFTEKEGIDKPLTHEEIIQLGKDELISIQSHGISHEDLSRMSLEQLRDELTESKEILQKMTGKQVNYLSTPSTTRLTKVLKKEAAQAGYRAIACCAIGTNNKNSDVFSLKRIIVEGSFNLREFKKNLEPTSIILRSFIASLKKIPPIILTPRVWMPIRRWLFSTRLASLLILRNLKRCFLIIFIILLLALIYYFLR